MTEDHFENNMRKFNKSFNLTLNLVSNLVIVLLRNILNGAFDMFYSNIIKFDRLVKCCGHCKS